jgi:hypothetical protein
MMYQKLFQITIVLFLVVVSIAVLGLLISVVMSMFSQQLMADSRGIVFAVSGITNRQFGYIIVASSLIVAGFYIFFRRRRFRR